MASVLRSGNAVWNQQNSVNNILKFILDRAIKAVSAEVIIRNSLSLENGNVLKAKSSYFKVDRNCYVVGFGKAVLGMCRETEIILGGHIQEGVLSVPVGIILNKNNKPIEGSKIRVYQGAENNIPDERALVATKDIVKLVSSLSETDLLIVLISGGGSALLTLPKPPLELKEKAKIIKALSRAGASIEELNCVRKSLSAVKGGRLAALTKAQVLSLILSDVIGDPLQVIASGPTAGNIDSVEKVRNILEKYSLLENIPGTIMKCIEEQSFPSSMELKKVTNLIIGNNVLALEAAQIAINQFGFSSLIGTAELEGKVENIAEKYATLVKAICLIYSKELSRDSFLDTILNLGFNDFFGAELVCVLESLSEMKLCLLFGGETTVVVSGKGKGGRNQELALRFSLELEKLENTFKSKGFQVTLLCAGTDGIDGPTEAAGAVAYAGQGRAARAQGLDPLAFLRDSDSFSYYSLLNGGHDSIRTGHTGTNVMDVHFLLIQAC